MRSFGKFESSSSLWYGFSRVARLGGVASFRARIIAALKSSLQSFGGKVGGRSHHLGLPTSFRWHDRLLFFDDKEFLSVMACFSAQLCRAIVLGGMDRIVAILGLHCL